MCVNAFITPFCPSSLLTHQLLRQPTPCFFFFGSKEGMYEQVQKFIKMRNSRRLLVVGRKMFHCVWDEVHLLTVCWICDQHNFFPSWTWWLLKIMWINYWNRKSGQGLRQNLNISFKKLHAGIPQLNKVIIEQNKTNMMDITSAGFSPPLSFFSKKKRKKFYVFL